MPKLCSSEIYFVKIFLKEMINNMHSVNQREIGHGGNNCTSDKFNSRSVHVSVLEKGLLLVCSVFDLYYLT